MNTLFFSPHALILQHSIPENLIMRALHESGCNVTVLGCKGLLINRCTSQDAHGILESSVTDNKKKLCKSCVDAQLYYIEKNKIGSHIFIDDLIDDACIKNAQQAYTDEINNLINYELSNVKIGGLALYETILTFKLLSEKLTNEAESYYRDLIYGGILVFHVALKMKTTCSYDALIVYNSQYCHNQVLSKTLSSVLCETYSIHNSLNFAHRNTRIMFLKDTFKKYINEIIRAWEIEKNKYCISQTRLRDIIEHLAVSSSGTNVMAYSEAVKKTNPLKRLNINVKSKVTLVVLSSTDELVAAEKSGYIEKKSDEDVFSNQIEWIEWLILWANKNKDRNLVIRIHPREMPNRRENATSESVNKYMMLFKDLPNNVKINWPEDKISVYDFLQYVDCVLTSWSSVGKEFALLGCPVISYWNKNRAYSNDIHPVARNKEEFERYLRNDYINKEFDLQKQMINTISWLNYEQFSSALDFEFCSSIWNYVNENILIKFLRKICKKFSFLNFAQSKSYPYFLIEKAKKIEIPDDLKNMVVKILSEKLSGPHIINAKHKSTDSLSSDQIMHYINKYIAQKF